MCYGIMIVLLYVGMLVLRYCYAVFVVKEKAIFIKNLKYLL
ncbi:hypothetical protein GV51_0750 [Gardnerella vaginalis 5-1]|nr:hypothetical protein GV51_0750 [Gardnerella vaginalis 5-1]